MVGGADVVKNLRLDKIPVPVTGGAFNTSLGFSQPHDIATDPGGDFLYVADTSNSKIWKIDLSNNSAAVFAGSTHGYHDDATGLSAQFNRPYGISVYKDSSDTTWVLVGDTLNYRIRRINAGTGAVETVAGSGTAGHQDGTSSSAQFKEPKGVTADSAGNIYVADVTNHRIRKIDATTGDVSTYAGTGVAGFTDGPAESAQFNQPIDMVFDTQGNLYVADHDNHRIRKIATDGTVSTYAGNGGTGQVDNADPLKAEIYLPRGLDIDAEGNLYVGAGGNSNNYIKNALRKITPQGGVTTLAGGPASVGNVTFTSIKGVAVNTNGVYAAERDANRVYRFNF
jgi:sugar lactone lactonase YvrE